MKHYIKICLVFLAFLGLQHRVNSQVNVKDSSVFAPLLHIGGGLHFPGGDLGQRFGFHASLGGEFLLKSRSNWLYGVQCYFLFGDNVKETDMLDAITTSNGQPINGGGGLSRILYLQRGWQINTSFGKVLDIWPINPNSGVRLQLSPGYYQHKIHIREDQKGGVPGLSDEYLKGYDRLTSGFDLTEFIGYQLLSNNRVINFYAGVEFTQAFTKSRRDYNFDTKMKDTSDRLDLSYTFRFGWIIPFYKRAPKDFYYR